jgi:hypothetical protein
MYVAQSICIWDSVWQAWVSQIIYYSDLLASPFPPPTQILAPFWLKYLMFASANFQLCDQISPRLLK